MTLTSVKYIALSLTSLAALGACATTVPATEQDYVSAVQRNIEAQAITPTDEQKANVNIPADPTLRAAARERYRTGTVKKPIPVSTN